MDVHVDNDVLGHGVDGTRSGGSEVWLERCLLNELRIPTACTGGTRGLVNRQKEAHFAACPRLGLADAIPMGYCEVNVTFCSQGSTWTSLA